MKKYLIHSLCLFALSLFFVGCSSSPERIDGSPFDNAQYDSDETYCRLQVKENHPHVASQLSHGNIPNTEGMSMAYMKFNNCMTEKGWKNFQYFEAT